MKAKPMPSEHPQSTVQKGGVVKGFLNFLSQYYVIGLAVGVVTGEAINEFIRRVVDGLINPFIGLFIPGSVIGQWQVTVGESVFKFGDIFSSAVRLLVVMLTVYVVFKLVLHREELLKKR